MFSGRPWPVSAPQGIAIVDLRVFGRAVRMNSRHLWATFTLAGHGGAALGRLVLVRAARRARLKVVRHLRGIASVLMTPHYAGTDLLLQTSFAPQHLVLELDLEPAISVHAVHRSFVPQLIGIHAVEALTSVYCCAAVSSSLFPKLLPQFTLAAHPKLVDGGLLGVAHRMLNVTAGGAPEPVSVAFHMLYLLSMRPPFEVFGLSIEFCLALDGRLAGPTPGMAAAPDSCAGACEPGQRITSMTVAADRIGERPGGGGMPRLRFVLEVGGLSAVADFPAVVLGPLLKPTEPRVLGSHLRMDRAR